MGYLIRRLLATLPVMAVVAIVVFLLIHLSPGDPAALIAGDLATVEDIARLRATLGLDQPLWQQFGLWAGRLASGDLGTSIFTQMPVTELLAQRLEPTLSIAALTMLLTLLVSVPLGTLAAYRAGSWVDRLVMLFAVLAFSLPVFLVGYLLVYAFAIQLPWFPVQGYARLADGAGAGCVAWCCRASTWRWCTSPDYPHDARHGAGSAARRLHPHRPRQGARCAAGARPCAAQRGHSDCDHGRHRHRAADRRRGGDRNRVRHSRRWPVGGGFVQRHDYPVIQSVLLLSAGAYVLINLMIDLSYRLFDPRIKY
jgi:peptide/nickel transport system permease protein